MIKAQLSQEQNKFARIVLSHSERDLTENDCKIVEEALKGWRKYPEEKPDKIKQNILVYIENNEILLLPFDNMYDNFDYNYDYMEENVTHWMPIPEIGE